MAFIDEMGWVGIIGMRDQQQTALFFRYFVRLNCAHLTCMNDDSEAIFRNARSQAGAWLDCRILDAIFLWRYVAAVQERDWGRVQGQTKNQNEPQKLEYDT